jgi:hypothetical protein
MSQAKWLSNSKGKRGLGKETVLGPARFERQRLDDLVTKMPVIDVSR